MTLSFTASQFSSSTTKAFLCLLIPFFASKGNKRETAIQKGLLAMYSLENRIEQLFLASSPTLTLPNITHAVHTGVIHNRLAATSTSSRVLSMWSQTHRWMPAALYHSSDAKQL